MADIEVQVGRQLPDGTTFKYKDMGDGTHAPQYSVVSAPVGVDHTALPVSGQKTVTTAGTAVALGSQAIGGPLMIKALDTNTGVVAVGNDGADDVTVSNGLRLSAGEVIVFSYVANLSDLYVDSAVNGEGVCWAALEVL